MKVPRIKFISRACVCSLANGAMHQADRPGDRSAKSNPASCALGKLQQNAEAGLSIEGVSHIPRRGLSH